MTDSKLISREQVADILQHGEFQAPNRIKYEGRWLQISKTDFLRQVHTGFGRHYVPNPVASGPMVLHPDWNTREYFMKRWNMGAFLEADNLILIVSYTDG